MTSIGSSGGSSELLRSGLARILDLWRDRFDGGDDLLQGVLRLQLADATGTAPPATSPEVRRAHDAIRAYFDNVRYVVLPPTAMLWGTVTNALRVAAGIDSVTPTQRAVFAFTATSLATFFRAAHQDAGLADALCQAFRPMPAADCQTVAALLDIHVDTRLDDATVVALTRVFGNEGPLTSEEAQAVATLERTGIIGAAFAGIRGRT